MMKVILVGAMLLVTFVYLYSLNGQHIPSNGDEYPYMHITRMTAQSGALLPLQSDLVDMRNTKPPMLFWQGIASTGWGQHWTQWRLRWPSVAYTLLTGLMVYLVASKLRGPKAGLAGFLGYVIFISTYRYGRPFLTDPGLVFWLTLPCFVLLYYRSTIINSRWIYPLLAGLALGIGFLYKSFILALPVGATLGWWYWRERKYSLVEFIKRDSWKLILMMGVGLGLFSLWFVFDPDPGSIVREFIFKENIGKMGKGNYLVNLLWGDSTVWSLAIEFMLGTGLLIVPTVTMMYRAFRERRSAGSEERMLWIWILTFFLVFTIPSQRSARYLLPVTPALAVLLGLYWDRIPYWAYRIALVLAGLFIGGVTYSCFRLANYAGASEMYPSYVWLILIVSIAVTVVALVRTRWMRGLVPVSLLLVYPCLTAFFHPLEHEPGRYPEDVIEQVRGREVWVTHNFNAKYERYRFLLPGADIHGYRAGDKLGPEELKSRYEYVGICCKMTDPAPTNGCTVLGSRLDVRTRHSGREIKEILFENRLDHLFVKEYLVRSSR
jgi:4-amino-4-deoxy-L-arabinose transferase-like glycosyltransferase